MKEFSKIVITRIMVLGLVLAFASSALATELKVKVKGMVCAFCVQGIEKAFKANPAVETVSVSLNEKLMTLKFKEGKSLEQKEISETLKKAGYEADFGK